MGADRLGLHGAGVDDVGPRLHRADRGGPARRPADRGVAARLRAFTDGYGLDERQRAELPDALGRRARAMHGFLRTNAPVQPWSRIWREDGPYWLATADYLDAHEDAWRTALD
ncbi:hypothetical protein AB0383_31270 [Amycolatopsis sp. NPDC051373]|uniref:hypothetical protein n=1 Tax=Amycolatopsis sp. NPDC051373 TaxID=3155801 RepID=UPI00344CC351